MVETGALLIVLRVGLVLLALAALAYGLARPRRTLAALHGFFLEPQPPLNLGLLRILVFGSLAFESLSLHAAAFATFPEEFRRPVAFWGFLQHSLPLPRAWVAPCERLLQLSAVLATAGVLTRITTGITTVLAVPLFLIPNLFFKVGHGPQVLIQQAALIALSRGGDALSFDAWRRHRRGEAVPRADAAYTLPVRFSWLLMGTMYLFPGLWKLWVSGDQWVSGEKLQREILVKLGHTPNYVPWVRIDQLHVLLAALGTATLVVEIGFFFSLVSRWARVWAALSVSGFHLGVGLTMGIWFNPVHPLLVLFDFPEVLEHPALSWCAPLRRRLKRANPKAAPLGQPPSSARSSYRLWPAAVAGAISLTAMFVTGTLGINSWPWGVYPRFHERVSGELGGTQQFEFVVLRKDGRRRVVHPTFAPLQDTAQIHVMLRRLLDPESRNFTRGLELVQRLVLETAGPFERGDRLEIYAYEWLLDPDLPRARRTTHRKFVARVRLL
jgi:hypothetical protein